MRETILVYPGITPPVKRGRPKQSPFWHDRQMLSTYRVDAKTRPLLLPCVHLNAKNRLVIIAKKSFFDVFSTY